MIWLLPVSLCSGELLHEKCWRTSVMTSTNMAVYKPALKRRCKALILYWVDTYVWLKWTWCYMPYLWCTLTAWGASFFVREVELGGICDKVRCLWLHFNISLSGPFFPLTWQVKSRDKFEKKTSLSYLIASSHTSIEIAGTESQGGCL